MTQPASPASPRTPRRTQAERSEAMRQKLVDAALACLIKDGYSGTTVSRIIEEAGVSRGAPLHHFPSKAALIAATAEQLIRQVYIQMGKAVARVEGSEDRLHELIYSAWQNVFKRPEYVALHELLVASRRDPELAEILLKVWTAGYFTLGSAADHYLEPLGKDSNVRQLMTLTQWLLRGMAEDLHILSDEGILDHYLKLWSQMLAQFLRARPGVTDAPPKPPMWDMSLSELP